MSLPPRTVVSIVSGLALITFAGWLFGLEWGPALLIAVGVVAVFGLRRIPRTNPDEDWPASPEADTDRGVRREVTRLSWSLHGYESRVERGSLLRLRAVADHRLRRRGLHLDDPADAARCRELLGTQAYRVITAERGTEVTFDEFSAALEVIGTSSEPTRRPS